MTRLMNQMRRLRPHMVDPWAFTIVAVSFGLGVMFVAWHGKSLKLEVEAANLVWIALIGFGMTWHGEWGSGWRVGSGLVAGSVVSIAAFYGALSILPITAFSFALGMGVAAMCLAFIAHMWPRMLSFAGTAVGFGVGVAAARSLPMRPTTPIDDMFTLMFTSALCMILGVAGSLALRAVVLRLGQQRSQDTTYVRFIPRLLHREAEARPSVSRPRVSRARIKAGAGR
jgi:hypothetical protein